MTLRLVLISLVAGLGLGLPSWPTIEGWVAGVQKWMNVQLAAADDREGERYVVIHDLLAAEMERAHAARLARRAAPHAAPPRPALIAVAHSAAPRRLATAPAVAATFPIELPKLDDYLSAAANAPALAAPEISAARADDLAMLAWDRIRPAGARLAASLAEGLRIAADRDRDARAFLAMEGSGDLYFDAAPVAPAEPAPLPDTVVAAVEGPEPAPVAALPAPVLAQPAPLPGFEAMEQSADIYFAAPIADDSAPAPEAMAVETPEPAAAELALGMADLPADVFAPTEPLPAAPIDPAPVAVAVAVAAEPDAPEVDRAVRLTREALSAWINVLTGPALVTASHGATLAR